MRECFFFYSEISGGGCIKDWEDNDGDEVDDCGNDCGGDSGDDDGWW